MKRIRIVICLIILMLPAAGLPEERGLQKVTLVPQWWPQAQFAGYMIALDKGFYREAGIDLTMARGGPGNPPFEALTAGKATFCTGWLSTGIQQRASGVPLVNLAQIVQRSSLVLIARKESGISSPETLNGKKMALWQGDFLIQPLALFRTYNIKPEVVPLYGTVNLFLKGGVDVMSAMWYNEYHTILNCGFQPEELSLLFFKDLLVNFPEDGIYCLEQTVKADPELCRRFVQASLKGWLYAFANQKEAIHTVMKYADQAHTETNRAHQRWMLARMEDLIIPDGDTSGLGKLGAKDYEGVGKVLMESGLIERTPKLEDFYRGP
ncbi:MAG TPA: ABC transporter substrate-binding protein [Desulfomonilaceae bacterium]|nr:ABC transporter substrate-binding protein [Desulfomonilaceae bacterium]